MRCFTRYVTLFIYFLRELIFTPSRELSKQKIRLSDSAPAAVFAAMRPAV